jgi:hypothetical protein
VSQGENAAPAPLLRVVRGEPTPEELAALVAVVVARRAQLRTAAAAGRPSAWGHASRAVRAPLRPAADGWRASGLPR